MRGYNYYGGYGIGSGVVDGFSKAIWGVMVNGGYDTPDRNKN